MKCRLHIVFTILLIIVFGIFGRIKSSTYTDITAVPNFMNEFYVAEIPSALAVEDCLTLKNKLPLAPIILKVTPVQPPEFFFKGWQQKVRIEQIYSGEDLICASEICILSNSWKVYATDKTINTGFVNFMVDGTDYLVFLTESIGYDKIGTEVFKLYTNMYIAPVFSCKSHDNLIYPTSGASTYVPYREVVNNEFFAEGSEGLCAFLELKKSLITSFGS